MRFKPAFLFALPLALVLLAGCGAAAPATLDQLQQQAYEAQAQGQLEEACSLIDQAQAGYPGQLDSALYQLAVQQGAQAACVQEAWQVLEERGDLTAPQLIERGDQYLEAGQAVRARGLYELAARGGAGEAAAQRLAGLQTGFAQEDDPLRGLLYAAGEALEQEDIEGLIGRLQQPDWLNAAMPATGSGARSYLDEDSGLCVTAEVTEGGPVTRLALARADAPDLSFYLSPSRAVLIAADTEQGLFSGPVQLFALNLAAGEYLEADCTAEGGLLAGPAEFRLFSIGEGLGAKEAWAGRQDQPAGTFAGEFDEAGQPLVQQRGGLPVLGYDGSGTLYLTLAAAEGRPEGQGVSVLELAALDPQEGGAL